MFRSLLRAACVLGLVAVAAAADKDYYFPEVRVEVAVGRDGSFTVDEFRSFAFEGRFSYAYIIIPVRIERSGVPRNVTVTDLMVTDEQGRSLRTEIDESGGRLTAKWHYSAENERRTFRIHYRVAVAGSPAIPMRPSSIGRSSAMAGSVRPETSRRR